MDDQAALPSTDIAILQETGTPGPVLEALADRAAALHYDAPDSSACASASSHGCPAAD